MTKKLKEKLDLAKTKVNKKELAEAVSILEEIKLETIEEACLSEINAYLGYSYIALGCNQNAITALQQIKSINNPLYPYAQYLLGRITDNLHDKVKYYTHIKEDMNTEFYKLSNESLFTEVIFSYCDQQEFNEAKLLLEHITIDSLQYKKLLLDKIISQEQPKNKNAFFNIFKIIENIIKELRIEIVENENCNQFSHYTSCYVTNLMLGFDPETTITQNTGKLRLGIIDMMNDPFEGNVLNSWLGIPDDLLNNRFNIRNFQSFASCFSFNHDSLNQFRLYGKTNNTETTGVSLVFNSRFFSTESNSSNINIGSSSSVKGIDKNKNPQENKYPLYRCIYYDPLSDYFRLAKRSDITFYRQGKLKSQDINDIKRRLNDYKKEIEEKEKNIEEHIKELSEIISDITPELNSDTKILLNDLLLPLRYLIKHAAFEEEEECRMIYIAALSDENIKQENGRIFVEYPPVVAEYIDKIYLGEGAKKERPFLELALQKAQKGQEKIAEVRDSDNPFRIFEAN